MRSSTLVIATLLLSGCFDGKDDSGGESSIGAGADGYIEAICRIQSDPTCVAQALDNCFIFIEFESAEACAAFYGASLATCPALEGWFAENSVVVDRCVTAINGLDCATDDYCAEDGGIDPEIEAACAAIDAAAEEVCGGGDADGAR